MKCPKCRHVNKDDAKECEDCGVVFAHIRGGRGKEDTIDRTCPWNDHGSICGVVGSLSDSTNGQGPWYCSKHYWKLKGYPDAVIGAAKAPSFRKRWYADHERDYEPPKKGNLDALIRKREPSDDDEVAA